MGRLYDLHYDDDSLIGKVGIDLSEARYDLDRQRSGNKRWVPRSYGRDISYADIRGASPLRGLLLPRRAPHPALADLPPTYAHVYEEHGYSFVDTPTKQPKK